MTEKTKGRVSGLVSFLCCSGVLTFLFLEPNCTSSGNYDSGVVRQFLSSAAESIPNLIKYGEWITGKVNQGTGKAFEWDGLGVCSSDIGRLGNGPLSVDWWDTDMRRFWLTCGIITENPQISLSDWILLAFQRKWTGNEDAWSCRILNQVYLLNKGFIFGSL